MVHESSKDRTIRHLKEALQSANEHLAAVSDAVQDHLDNQAAPAPAEEKT